LKINKAFVYVGCFEAAGCGGWDAFIETGLSSIECSNIATCISMACNSGCGYNVIQSYTSMTVDLCVQICNTHGFTYAGLAQ